MFGLVIDFLDEIVVLLIQHEDDDDHLDEDEDEVVDETTVEIEFCKDQIINESMKNVISEMVFGQLGVKDQLVV
jgi:hypothetical protein